MGRVWVSRWPEEPPLIPDALPDVCNAECGDCRKRPCRLPPRAIGERGRLLCTGHLNRESAYLDMLDEVATTTGLGEHLAGELGEVVAGAVSVEIKADWRIDAPDGPPGVRALVMLEMSFGDARELIRRLGRPTAAAPER